MVFTSLSLSVRLNADRLAKNSILDLADRSRRGQQRIFADSQWKALCDEWTPNAESVEIGDEAVKDLKKWVKVNRRKNRFNECTVNQTIAGCEPKP